MKIFEEIAFRTICAVNEAKYNPVKAVVKLAGTTFAFYTGGRIMLNICDITTISYQNMKEAIEFRTKHGMLREDDLKYLNYVLDELRFGGFDILVKDGVKIISYLLILGLISKTDADKAIKKLNKR